MSSASITVETVLTIVQGPDSDSVGRTVWFSSSRDIPQTGHVAVSEGMMAVHMSHWMVMISVKSADMTH